MTMLTKIICLFLLYEYSFAFLLDPSYPRAVSTLLWTQHYGHWGSWRVQEYCEKGYYAIGYEMKIEGQQGSRDDTALNAIGLVCASRTNMNLDIRRSLVTSGQGSWGDWGDALLCPQRNGVQTYLTQYAIQSEQDQHDGDDTAANYVKFMCRSFEGGESSELVVPPGQGFWGSWSQWSEACPAYSAICGLQTKVENMLIDGDDTALNDVKFMCCFQD